MDKLQPEEFHDLTSARDYWAGRVVSRKNSDRRWYGHIRGFSRNGQGEVLIVILWEDGKEIAVHPANLFLY